jgi:hypothetical protein
MERIVVRIEPLAVDVGRYHMYIVYIDFKGREWIFEGRPEWQQPVPDTKPRQQLVVNSFSPGEKNKRPIMDAAGPPGDTPNPTEIPVAVGANLGGMLDALFSAAKYINAQNIEYDLLNENSNAAVNALLRAIGKGPVEFPEHSTPGARTVIPMPTFYVSPEQGSDAGAPDAASGFASAADTADTLAETTAEPLAATDVTDRYAWARVRDDSIERYFIRQRSLETICDDPVAMHCVAWDRVEVMPDGRQIGHDPITGRWLLPPVSDATLRRELGRHYAQIEARFRNSLDTAAPPDASVGDGVASSPRSPQETPGPEAGL